MEKLGIIASAGVAGASASIFPAGSMWIWLAPILCGVLAALLVRGIAVTKPSRKAVAWRFEACITALSVLLVAVMVADHGLGIMDATVTGIAIGSLGVGIVGAGRKWAASLLVSAGEFLSRGK